MKQTIQILLFTFLILLFTSNAFSQRLNYKLKAGGVKLGEFKLEKHIFNDTIIYLLKSKVSINLLITKHIVDYSSITTYYKGVLIEAQVKAVENGELEKKTITKKTATGYHVSKYEDEEKKEFDFKHSGIKYSSTRLFFEKPVLNDSSYAELYGNFGYFSVGEDGEIIITNQDTKSETEYYYEKNTPIKRKIEYPIVDFVMYLISESVVVRSKNDIYNEYFGTHKTSP